MIKRIIKKYLARLAIQLGILNFSLKVAEMAARNFTFTIEIPFPKWTEEISSILEQANNDGKLDNTELEEIVTWVKTITPDSYWINKPLSLAGILLRNVQFTIPLPYKKWTEDMVDKLHKALDDGEIDNIEVADLIKFIRENR